MSLISYSICGFSDLADQSEWAMESHMIQNMISQGESNSKSQFIVFVFLVRLTVDRKEKKIRKGMQKIGEEKKELNACEDPY